MSNSQACYCTVCHLNTHSIPGTRHRRCSGESEVLPRKHKPRADKRGTWQPGIWTNSVGL